MSAPVDLGLVWAIARHELRILLRSRWVPVYAAVFAVLTCGVAYFGLAVVEYTGFQSFDRTAVSLLNLVLYIVPLAVMLMAVQSFRPEGGITEQLLAEPVTRTEIVLGKLIGLAGAHVTAALFGFGATGILIAVNAGSVGLPSYLAVVAFTLLVGLVFLSIASLITVLARRGLRAYALVMATWFLLVLLFDLIVIGGTFLLPEPWDNRLAVGAVLVNPVDTARVAALLATAGKEVFGPAGAWLSRTFGGATQATVLLSCVLVAWIAVPAIAAAAVLRRQDV